MLGGHWCLWGSSSEQVSWTESRVQGLPLCSPNSALMILDSQSLGSLTSLTEGSALYCIQLILPFIQNTVLSPPPASFPSCPGNCDLPPVSMECTRHNHCSLSLPGHPLRPHPWLSCQVCEIPGSVTPPSIPRSTKKHEPMTATLLYV
jgi:hypothetical protein